MKSEICLLCVFWLYVKLYEEIRRGGVHCRHEGERVERWKRRLSLSTETAG